MAALTLVAVILVTTTSSSSGEQDAQRQADSAQLWLTVGDLLSRAELSEAIADAEATAGQALGALAEDDPTLQELSTAVLAAEERMREDVVIDTASVESSGLEVPVAFEPSAADFADLAESVRTASRAVESASEEAAAGGLDYVIAAAERQLEAWEPVALESSTLADLRSALADAKNVPADAAPTQVDDVTAQLRQALDDVPTISTVAGHTTIDGVLVVNKSIPLASDYAPGMQPETAAAFEQMREAAAGDGVVLWIESGYRSYTDQRAVYSRYVDEFGAELADTFSSRPGHSEHQTGLTIDVNDTTRAFIGTPEAAWLERHAAEYGFVVRFPEDKTEITGYTYEPWHLRYLGVELAQYLTANSLTLEEYFGVTSAY